MNEERNAQCNSQNEDIQKYQDIIEEYLKQITEMHDDCQHMQQTIENLENKLLEEIGVTKVLNDKLNQKESLINEQNQQIQQIQSIEQEVNVVKHQNAQLRNKNDQIQKQFEEEKQYYLQEVEEIQRQCLQLGDRYILAQDEIKRLTQNIQAREESLKELNQVNQIMESNLNQNALKNISILENNYNIQYEELRKKLQDQLRQNDSLNSTIKEMQFHQKTHSYQKQNLENEFQLLSQQLVKTQQLYDSSLIQIQNLQKQNDDCIKNLKKSQNDLHVASSKINVQYVVDKNLEIQYIQQIQTYQELQAQFNKNKEKLEQQSSQLKEQINKMENEAKIVKIENQSLKCQCSDYQHQIQKLENLNNDYQEKYADLRIIKEKLKSTITENDDLSIKIQQLLFQNQQLNIQVSQLELENKNILVHVEHDEQKFNMEWQKERNKYQFASRYNRSSSPSNIDLSKYQVNNENFSEQPRFYSSVKKLRHSPTSQDKYNSINTNQLQQNLQTIENQVQKRFQITDNKWKTDKKLLRQCSNIINDRNIFKY